MKKEFISGGRYGAHKLKIIYEMEDVYTLPLPFPYEKDLILDKEEHRFDKKKHALVVEVYHQIPIIDVKDENEAFSVIDKLEKLPTKIPIKYKAKIRINTPPSPLLDYQEGDFKLHIEKYLSDWHLWRTPEGKEMYQQGYIIFHREYTPVCMSVYYKNDLLLSCDTEKWKVEISKETALYSISSLKEFLPPTILEKIKNAAYHVVYHALEYYLKPVAVYTEVLLWKNGELLSWKDEELSPADLPEEYKNRIIEKIQEKYGDRLQDKLVLNPSVMIGVAFNFPNWDQILPFLSPLDKERIYPEEKYRAATADLSLEPEFVYVVTKDELKALLENGFQHGFEIYYIDLKYNFAVNIIPINGLQNIVNLLECISIVKTPEDVFWGKISREKTHLDLYIPQDLQPANNISFYVLFHFYYLKLMNRPVDLEVPEKIYENIKQYGANAIHEKVWNEAKEFFRKQFQVEEIRDIKPLKVVSEKNNKLAFAIHTEKGEFFYDTNLSWHAWKYVFPQNMEVEVIEEYTESILVPEVARHLLQNGYSIVNVPEPNMEKIGKYLVGITCGGYTVLGYGSGYYEIVAIDTETREVFMKALDIIFGDNGGYNDSPEIGECKLDDQVDKYVRSFDYDMAFRDNNLSDFLEGGWKKIGVVPLDIPLERIGMHDNDHRVQIIPTNSVYRAFVNKTFHYPVVEMYYGEASIYLPKTHLIVCDKEIIESKVREKIEKIAKEER